VHVIETLVDIVQFPVMSDVFVNLDFSIKVILERKKELTPYAQSNFRHYLGQVLEFRSCL